MSGWEMTVQIVLLFLRPALLIVVGIGFGIWSIALNEGIIPREVLRRFRIYCGK